MQRYDCETTGNSWVGCLGEMVPAEGGDWVKWEDHQSRVAELERHLDSKSGWTSAQQDEINRLQSALKEIRSKFPGSSFCYEQYAKEAHLIATIVLNYQEPPEPGKPRDWDHPTLEAFVENNYWHNPEDAIGDIRLYITRSKS